MLTGHHSPSRPTSRPITHTHPPTPLDPPTYASNPSTYASNPARHPQPNPSPKPISSVQLRSTKQTSHKGLSAPDLGIYPSMRVTVVTIWPTYIDDLGKPPVYRIAYPHDHTPAWGPALNAPGTYRNKADAQAMAERINGSN